jgi:hypothetical protein
MGLTSFEADIHPDLLPMSNYRTRVFGLQHIEAGRFIIHL